jgi:hypothetical protein
MFVVISFLVSQHLLITLAKQYNISNKDVRSNEHSSSQDRTLAKGSTWQVTKKLRRFLLTTQEMKWSNWNW